jgi:transcriptional regulator, propionate catabolism operon regulatory protein
MNASSHADERKPIIWAVSLSKLNDLYQQIIPSYYPFADIEVIQKGFDDAVHAVRERSKSEEVDVVVAAGSNGAFLRRHLGLSVVLVKVTGFDMLEALAKARRVSERIAIVTHQTITPELEQFKHLFKLDIEQRQYTTADDAKECVRELVSNGIKVIVGPGLITELAEQAGVAGIFLYSLDSVREAFDDAIEVARIGRIGAARRERLNTILRHLHEGVVAVDMAERIQSLNPAMERLLGVTSRDVVGRPFSEIAPDLSLVRTLDKGVSTLEEIHQLGNRVIVANRIPIQEQGVQTGAVLTFQDSTSIQRVDRNLRSHHKPRHLTAKYRLSHIIGNSPAIRRVKALAAKYATTDATVLITGESGTGKELLAQGIHSAGRRENHPFVAVNCAAFPESLLESELFGYEEGAFTGSRQGGKAGLFEVAHTGTIFLDEVGEMPIALQSRLLRVLQEREVWRLGSSDSTPIDVRVIVATNRKLRERVSDGQFREDLYYRLNILRLDLPPLRERQEDLPTIAAYLLDKARQRLGSKQSWQKLLEVLRPHLGNYAWPGNVRELENIIERVAVHCCDMEGTHELDPAQLRNVVPELFGELQPDPAGGLRAASRLSEIEHIKKVLDECNGDRRETSRRLGIGRTTLWRKLRDKGLAT